MNYNYWSPSAEDRLFDTTLCTLWAGQSPVSLGTAGDSLLLALGLYWHCSNAFSLAHIFLDHLSSFTVLSLSFSPAVCSLQNSVCTWLNNTLGNPTKAPCFQLLCEQLKSRAHILNKSFFHSFFFFSISLAPYLLHLFIIEGQPFHSPVPVSLTQPIIPSL